MNESTMRSKKTSKDTLKQMKRKTKQSKNLWVSGKVLLRGKVTALQAYLKTKTTTTTKNKTQEKAQINNLTLHLKDIEKEQQTKPKVSRRKEIIKIRIEINDIES